MVLPFSFSGFDPPFYDDDIGFPSLYRVCEVTLPSLLVFVTLCLAPVLSITVLVFSPVFLSVYDVDHVCVFASYIADAGIFFGLCPFPSTKSASPSCPFALVTALKPDSRLPSASCFHSVRTEDLFGLVVISVLSRIFPSLPRL